MSDEVYEGAIGIDLGMVSFRRRKTPDSKTDTYTARHDLFLRCKLRGHQCRN